MTINDEQDARITLVLQGLDSCMRDLYPNAQNFVKDQIERHAKYGAGITVSPKQMAWLERLYAEFVGEPQEQTPREEQPVDDRIRETTKKRNDPDDEIPF